jgi:hypothetical protein
VPSWRDWIDSKLLIIFHPLPTCCCRFLSITYADCPAGTCGKRVKGSFVCSDAGAGLWSAGGSSSATTLRQALGSCVGCKNGLTTQPSSASAASAPGRYIATKPSECGKLLPWQLLLPTV